MFDLSLVDTLRLAFGQVVYHHKSHSRAASSLARWSRWFRAGETILMTGVVIAALGASFGSSSLALLTFLIHVTFDFESTARAHHVCSTRLWSIREQYRGLLSDLNDRAIDPEIARARRNVLMEEVTAVYESAPPMTRRIFKLPLNSTESAEELALADEEIDRFLPKSLHGAGKVAPAS
jgi:hypothetical protein